MKLAGLCLQLDVGNSSAKWRLIHEGEVEARGRYQLDDTESCELLLNCAPGLDHIWISSVTSGEREAALSGLLEGRWGVTPWFARSELKTDKLRNSYAEPIRLGVDRWLAMLGGTRRLAGRFAVIDAGSALTIDIVDESGLHEGGYIIPGPDLMERALLLDTDKVRFAEDASYDLHPGQSTAEAVRHGIAAAQAGAVALVLDRAGIESRSTLFCGGGAETLMSLPGSAGAHVPDLVFEGLQIMAEIHTLK
jgi:type III pantothenate kinase